ncbi:cytochrome c3 family protein [Bacillus sp. EB600]|uniref:cytochrome c3 family protein n=1 Tax=Bacillus sp. EB600 TaxID=2806345 RepID=UPI00210EC1EF|nr:cytochrome c3 family protein [Bacillus sp. EB600]MCQ6278713.1 hypothetical protein [Bacillus sp. EB600]
MSRLKISLSALFMLLFLGMFGAAASAAGFDPTNLQHPASTLNNATIDNNGDPNLQRTHGNFQNNTNSCANCHSTHNGETSTLLMKSSGSELCMSCHDGTLGFYNVKEASEAGIMYSQDTSASMHHVDSELQVSAAPGAQATEVDTNGSSLKNTETATFECSSCHNPHGSVNDRILNETVAGNQFAGTYDVYVNNTTHEEKITKLTTVPLGTAGIKLNLQLDPAYKAINDATGSNGLKITKSSGIYTAADPTNPAVDTLAKVYDKRLNYSAFCGSCHTDYYRSREDGPRDQLAQDGSHLYSHSTSSTKSGRACTSCHYAHGTDITLLKDTSGRTIADLQKSIANGGNAWSEDKARAYMKDVSKDGKSNLKRYTNMAVCWACHQSTHQIDTQGAVNMTTKTVLSPIPGGDYSAKTNNQIK